MLSLGERYRPDPPNPLEKGELEGDQINLRFLAIVLMPKARR